MASPITLLYGSSGQAITCTWASLASAASRASSAIDNTTNLWEDIKVQPAFTTGSTGTVATGVVNIYAVDTCDNGTTYGEGATGSDAAITLTVPTNAKLIGQVNAVANSKLYPGCGFSVAFAFGGKMPAKVVIIPNNVTGHALAATTPILQYQGVAHQA